MKKDYVSPVVKEVEINADTLIAGSIGKGEGEIDPGQSWTNRRRGQNDWDNIWSN